MGICTKFVKTNFILILCSFLLPIFTLASKLKADPSSANISPIAINVENFLIQNISGRSQILPLLGSDQDGSIVKFKIKVVMNNSQGRLYLDGNQINNNKELTVAEAKRLQFEVKDTFTGPYTSFTFSAIDNNGAESNTATFTIPVTTDGTQLVCRGGGLGANILGATGTFSVPYIQPNPTISCINNGAHTGAPIANLGQAKPELTTYTYAATTNSLGPEGTYSFLKTIGQMDVNTRNCIKTDWVASDHTGDGGYAMIVNGSPNSTTFGKTFYQAKSIQVCPNTLYEFSAYVINVLPGNHTAAKADTEPNISFFINNQLVSTSGKIAYSTASTGFVPQWVKVGGLWYSGPNTSVDLRIDNATFIGGGNDLGLDDISMAICGPEITYPDIDLQPKFCSYGVLPLNADVKASVNTYSSYIFQQSTDGGLSWTDLGQPKTGSPIYDSQTNSYSYLAEYGNIPITPAMNGYKYRLKVATEAANLVGLTCNVSADKVITVSAFDYPVAGADISSCEGTTTAKLKAAGSGENWSPVPGNPAAASIDGSGNITGMTVNGVYRFKLSNSIGCEDIVEVTRDHVFSAGADVVACGSEPTYKLIDAPAGYKWFFKNGNPVPAQIDLHTGEVTGMTEAGAYQFILRSDFGGCEDEVTIFRSYIVLTGVVSNNSCFGEDNGAIDLKVTGGVAPFNFLWSNGATTEDLVGVGAGTYTVTVTDAAGCSVTESFNITQPAAALSASYTSVDLSCYGDTTGSIALTVTGGTAPYTYAWDNGQTTQNLTGLAAGTYNVTITDAAGCTVTESVTITQPAAALTASSTAVNVNCYGETTGSITLAVTGGTAPYTYLWSTGETSPSRSNLAAGTYHVTITDAAGCTLTESVTITQPAAALSASSTSVNVNCYGEATGSITLAVTGGTAPYTYAWDNGQTAQNLAGLAAGTHSVTIIDAAGCTVTESVTITQPAAALVASSTSVNVNCFGESTGSINLAVTGGTAPYTYAWDNGQTTQNLAGLAAGTYNVTITDAAGCTLTESVTITQPAAALVASSTSVNVNCYGEATGSITLAVTGGTAPYTYLWSTGETSPSISNLAAGTYNVTITDAAGCTVTESVTITQPSAALTATLSAVNVNCFGASTGSITLAVTGGTAPYTYAWDNGQTTPNLTGLAAGTYNVTITDAAGCTVTESVTITQPAAALVASSTSVNVNCFGESTGSINLAVTGGTAPYTYLWSTGETSPSRSNLAAGTYNVTITDAAGCTVTESVTITQPAAALTASSTFVNVNCFGESTGSITLIVTGGTAPYTYAWDNGQTTQNLAGLAAGTYNVTITDAAGCTLTESVTITQPAAALTATLSAVNVNCYGESTGSITLAVTGGTAPYSYAWDNGQTTPNLSGLAAGTYNVTITDAAGCTVTESATITQPAAALVASSTSVNVNCFGASTGSINLAVTGGTAPYTFAWDNGQTTQNLAGLAAGPYNVTITDAAGCTVTESVTITQPAAALSASSTAVNVNCFGESTGSITLALTGGTAPYTYAWDNGQTTQNLTGLAAGTYNVTITDAAGCTVTESVTITQPAAALTASSTSVNVNCFGESTGSITLAVTGGTAPYTYLWSTGETSPSKSNLAAGTYSVTITDAAGCTVTESVTITQPAAALVATSTSVNVNCFGESTGSITLIVTGGTAPYTYAWDNGQTTPNLSGLAAGIYNVTITDAAGCTLTESVTITQPAAALVASSTSVNVNCYGEATGSITLAVTGGTAPYTYLWSTGETSPSISNLAAGTYNVTITDAAGCTVTESVTITQPSAALTATLSAVNVNCFGASTGSITLAVTGGTAPYTYAWDNGQTTPNLTGLAAGPYNVTITDAAGCTFTESVTITQPAAALSASSTAVNVNCFGESTGSITLALTGGTAPYTYAWDNGQTTPNLTGLAAGTYNVTITDAAGCTVTESVTITQPAAALVASSTSVNVNCFGESTGSINLAVTGGTAPYTYLWSTGETSSSRSNLAAGTYSITITDAAGCTVTESVTITQPAAALVASSTSVNVNCYGESTGSITLAVTGGTAPYTYLWSTGETSPSRSNLAAGTYNVTITDAAGCTVTESVTITQPAAALTATLSAVNVNCYGESTGSITLAVTGGTAPYSYAWDNGQTTPNLSGLAAGTYNVTITDAAGCTVTESATITQPAAALVASSTSVNVNCYGEATGSITLVVTGGTAPYTYLWSTGETSPSRSNLAAGTYNVTITDAVGCTVTESVTITHPAAALVASSTSVNVNCYGESTGSITLAVTGGTAPYTYLWSTGETSPSRSNLAAGTYSVTITDAAGCSLTESVTITQPAAALVASSTSVNVNCYGEATGSITLAVTGGTAPYTYAWDNGQTTQNLTGLAAGTYNVTITDAAGCTFTESVTITQPAAALSASSTAVNVNCFGESTGSITLALTGGTAPYTYAWDNGQTTPNLTGLAAGTYNVTITDAAGCTVTESATITQPAAALVASSTSVNVNCFGASTGSINLAVTGGTAPYTFAWDNGQTTQNLAGLAAGTYNVTITDAAGCTVTESVTITQPAAALVASSTSVNVNCYGEATGSITLAVTGGTAPYTYAWDNGQTTPNLSGLAAGIYNVTITDAAGCTLTESVTITQPAAALVASSTSVNVNCYGEATGSITLVVTGGTAPYTYAWDNGQTTPNLTGLAAGTYNVTITDAAGCTLTESVTINQPAAALTATLSAVNVNCFGESTGSITLAVTGGTAPYTYLWSTGETSPSRSNLAAGTYNVTITDAAGCTLTESATITQPAAALVASSTSVNVNCYGEATGSITLVVTGGTAPYTYLWSTWETSPSRSNLAAGTYNVTITDAAGCTVTESVTITQPAAALTASSTSLNVNCYGESTGSITLAVKGGTAPYTYAWDNGQNTPNLSGLAAGTYNVTITDAAGFTVTESVTITQPAAALVATSTSVNVNCYGESTGSITLAVTGGTAPYTYLWSTGETSPSRSNLAAGTYSITITDAVGCTVTESVTITQPAAALTASSTAVNVNCYGEATGSITLAVTGGTAPYTYAWDNGQTTQNLSSLAAGTYRVIITDGNGCTLIRSATISQSPKLDLNIRTIQPSCDQVSDGAIEWSIVGGVAPYRIELNGLNISTNSITGLKAGEYDILVRDAVGCEGTTKVILRGSACKPGANDDSYTAAQNTTISGDVSSNDSVLGGTPLFSKLTDPEGGKLSFLTDGSFTFEPYPGFTGKTKFSYNLCTSSGACDTADVFIEIKPISIVNLTPELISTREGGRVVITARLTQAFTEDVTIKVSYSGAAQESKDYLVLDQYQSLTIPKGSTTTAQRMTFAILNDGLEEGNEDIIITITSTSNSAVRIGNGSVIIINDVYPPPPPTDQPQDEPINTELVIDPLLSPNGDGLGNEYFHIGNIEDYPDNAVRIFNRWGNELFSIKNYNNKDKVFNGYANKGLLVNDNQPLADGVYYYIIVTNRIEGGKNVSRTNKGYIILKR